MDENEALEVELEDAKDILEKVKTDHEKSVPENEKVTIWPFIHIFFPIKHITIQWKL